MKSVNVNANVDIKANTVTLCLIDNKWLASKAANAPGSISIGIGDDEDPVCLSNTSSPSKVHTHTLTYDIDFNRTVDLSDNATILLAVEDYDKSCVYSSETPLNALTDSVVFTLQVNE